MTKTKHEGDAVYSGVKCPTPGCDGTISFVDYADRYYSGNVLIEECMFYCIRCDKTCKVYQEYTPTSYTVEPFVVTMRK